MTTAFNRLVRTPRNRSVTATPSARATGRSYAKIQASGAMPSKHYARRRLYPHRHDSRYCAANSSASSSMRNWLRAVRWQSARSKPVGVKRHNHPLIPLRQALEEICDVIFLPNFGPVGSNCSATPIAPWSVTPRPKPSPNARPNRHSTKHPCPKRSWRRATSVDAPKRKPTPPDRRRVNRLIS